MQVMEGINSSREVAGQSCVNRENQRGSLPFHAHEIVGVRMRRGDDGGSLRFANLRETGDLSYAGKYPARFVFPRGLHVD